VLKKGVNVIDNRVCTGNVLKKGVNVIDNRVCTDEKNKKRGGVAGNNNPMFYQSINE
jgi:hypothetical protein